MLHVEEAAQEVLRRREPALFLEEAAFDGCIGMFGESCLFSGACFVVQVDPGLQDCQGRDQHHDPTFSPIQLQRKKDTAEKDKTLKSKESKLL